MNIKNWKNVLVVITDPFSRRQPALTKAAALARRTGARLTLFNAFMFPQPLPEGPWRSSEAILAAATEQREQQLKRLARGLRSGTPARCVVRWDYPPHEAVVREVLASKPDLVLAESHRERRLARLVLANTDWELIRTCPCPLWFVRSGQLPRRPQILVAVDPTHAHDKPARLDSLLLASARSLAQPLEGHVAVVHAHETLRDALTPAFLKLLRMPAPPSGDTAGLARAVQELASPHAIDPDDCHVSEGRVAEVIEKAVQQAGADVLVMGAVSRSLSGFPLIGGSAERVIDHVDCDVLVIKPPGFKTPVGRRPATLRPAIAGGRSASSPRRRGIPSARPGA